MSKMAIKKLDLNRETVKSLGVKAQIRTGAVVSNPDSFRDSFRTASSGVSWTSVNSGGGSRVNGSRSGESLSDTSNYISDGMRGGGGAANGGGGTYY
jgi:hypothetical protein